MILFRQFRLRRLNSKLIEQLALVKYATELLDEKDHINIKQRYRPWRYDRKGWDWLLAHRRQKALWKIEELEAKIEKLK